MSPTTSDYENRLQGKNGNGLANSPRPLPIARIQSDTAISGVPSWAEIEGSARINAPQYAPPPKNKDLATRNLSECLVTAGLDDLRAHPSYERYGLCVSAAQLSRLAELEELSFQEPLLITSNGIVLDGYGRWKLAKLKNRSSLVCTIVSLNEAEALQILLQRHRRTSEWNAFIRTVLALDLEPTLRDAARERQSLGGQHKGLANLPKAEELHVRNKLAALAGVCPRYVSKVKELLARAAEPLLEALRNGEIKIHRAWKWSKQPVEDQVESLWEFRLEKGIKKTVRRLIPGIQSSAHPCNSGDLEQALQSGRLASVKVFPVRVPGRAIFMTDEAFAEIERQQRMTH